MAQPKQDMKNLKNVNLRLLYEITSLKEEIKFYQKKLFLLNETDINFSKKIVWYENNNWSLLKDKFIQRDIIIGKQLNAKRMTSDGIKFVPLPKKYQHLTPLSFKFKKNEKEKISMVKKQVNGIIKRQGYGDTIIKCSFCKRINFGVAQVCVTCLYNGLYFQGVCLSYLDHAKGKRGTRPCPFGLKCNLLHPQQINFCYKYFINGYCSDMNCKYKHSFNDPRVKDEDVYGVLLCFKRGWVYLK